MRITWGRLLTVLTILVLTTGCPPNPPPVPVVGNQDSVRIGTFNTQFLPGSDDDETRSAKIAARILASTYDIIALNEVFDEEARETFISKLKGTFPHYVSYLGDDAVGSQDSGLMLFSRFPFEPLPVATYKAESDDVDARNGAMGDWKDVAFIEYDADVFPDNWAAKGIAFVRIKNTNTNRIYNIAFTHMQASYPEDEDDLSEWKEPIDARGKQLNDVQKIIQGTLTSGQFMREATFLLGDLNIDGDLADANLGGNAWGQPNLYEWVERFNTPGRFFSTSMIDAWAFEQSPDDRGLTNHYHWGPPFAPETSARLDYILRNRTTQSDNTKLCVQHMTLAHNLREGSPYIESGLGMAGITELSDHIGLNADINRWAQYCNPLEARANPNLDLNLGGTITYPGSMQWLRFDMAGTYAFHMQSGACEYRVYESRDLSTPAPQYYGETTTFKPLRGEPVTGEKFHLPEAPFYIRVFNPDRMATGNYTFIAHRNNCTSMEEACVLRANEPLTHTLPATPINTDDTAWFELQLEVADSGSPQDLHFILDGFTGDPFDLELRESDGTTVIDSAIIAVPNPDLPSTSQLVIRRSDLGTKATKLYLLVKRTDLSATAYRIGWETNLTILHGALAGIAGAVQMNIYCVEETDTIGIDEVYLTVKADGNTIVNDVYIGDYDNGVYRTLEDLIPVTRYLSNVQVILREEDGGANGDDDFLTTTIQGLPVDKTSDLSKSNKLASAGGEYLFRYNRSRSLQMAP